MPNPTSSPIMIEKYWESIPPAWRQTHIQIRRIAVEKFKMTEEQFQVLHRIRIGNKSVSVLAEVSQTSRSAVSKAVNALARRGMVTCSQDPDDRRYFPLGLTDKGQRVKETISTEAETWLSVRFECLNPDQLENLLLGMETLHKAFSNP